MSRIVRPMTLILALVCGEVYAQKIYWANSPSGQNPNGRLIQRSNLDGTSVETLLSSGFDTPFGIALDLQADKMYFTDLIGPNTGKVMRANLDGTGFEVLVSGLGAPAFIDLDIAGGKMYWATLLNFPSSDRIQRANLDGTGLENLVTGLSAAMGFALDLPNGKMYWTEATDRKVRRANLDGTGIEDIVVDTSPNRPVDVAIDHTANKLYWTDGDQNGVNAKVMVADLNGLNRQTLVSGLDNVGGLALDVAAGKMYWVDTGTAKIQRANLDGTIVEDVVTTGLMNLAGIAVDPRVQGCGNNIVEPPEQCDDGNTLPGDGCDENCVIEECGNGVIQFGEECDDGNLIPGDGCSELCLREPGACCLPGATCVTHLNEADCLAQGGAYAGDGTSCACRAQAPIPAISQWGLVAMTLLVLAAGTVVLARRRRVSRPI
ncbi:MAG: DUF4215 domain-containing protein [Phycisphaerae bacterium]